jgi:hypothetical protein
MKSKLIITEEEKNDILSKYQGELDSSLYNHLRRHFIVQTHQGRFSDMVYHTILIDDKTHPLKSNKKNLVNRIYYQIDDLFPNITKPSKRLTIKKFLGELVDYYKLN